MSFLHSVRHAITLMEELVSLSPSWHYWIKWFQSLNFFKVTCLSLEVKFLGLGFLVKFVFKVMSLKVNKCPESQRDDFQSVSSKDSILYS